MPENNERRIIEFDRLNLLGKAVFLTGAVLRTTASVIDGALEKTVDLILEAERAFQEGRDPNVEEAKVLREWKPQEPEPEDPG